MSLTYFKRFRMEVDLRTRDFAGVRAPRGYRLLPWDSTLVEAHAEAKFNSFRTEIDANVFPCLGDYSGCLRLMNEICRKPGFLPQTTWLLVADPPLVRSAAARNSEESYVGTVQGIVDSNHVGAIQNLGIVPEHRGHGLGTILMLKALEGFQRAGLSRAFLEVTSKNEGAIRLYRRLGFSKARTVYKVVEVAYS